jgi:hypothetical protein
VAGLLLVAGAAPAHATPAAELITPVPPAGFTTATLPGMPDGSLDLKQMTKLAGVDQPTGLEDVGWDGAVRVWTGPGNQAAMVIAGRTKDAATAQDAAAGALAGALDVDEASTFSSALPGVQGAVATKNGAHAELVAWSQGQYLVMAIAATTDDAHTLSDDLVTRQAQFLRTRAGVGPSANAAPDSGFDSGLLGAAGLVLVALIAGGIWFARRNRSTPDAPPLLTAGTMPGGPAPGPLGPVGTPDAFAMPPPAAAAPRPAPAPIPFVREPKAGPAPIPFRPTEEPAPTAPADRAPAPAAAPVAAPPEPGRASPDAPGGLESWDDRFAT